MRRDLNKLRHAAERRVGHHGVTWWERVREYRKAERRAESELQAFLEAVDVGEPVERDPVHLDPEGECERADLDLPLRRRRGELAATGLSLREAGVENDLTRRVEDAGLLPEEPEGGPPDVEQEPRGE